MALSIPLVWSDDHRLHEPEAEIWVGVRTPAAEVPARAEAIRAALVGAGAEVVAAAPHDDSVLEAVHDEGLLAFLASAWREWEAAGLPDDPGQDRVVPYIFPHPGLLGGLDAARPGRDVGATGGVLLRHDDADRARDLGGRAGRRRRRPHRRRPRLRGRTAPPTPAAARPATTSRAAPTAAPAT